MTEQLYKKVGRKYIPIGYADGFCGFPAEGIWIVYNKPGSKSETCIAQVGKFKKLDYELLANLVKEKEDKCLAIFHKINKEGKSAYDLIRELFNQICSE